MNLCNPADLSVLFARHGFSFSKTFGQNFLIDAAVPEKIAATAKAAGHSHVLEIGPGAGALTAALAKRFESVVALELDLRLLPLLAEALAEFPHVKIRQGDVLKTDLAAFTAENFPSSPIELAANLPYNITTPAVKALLGPRVFAGLTLMVQKEVAAKMTALPGEKGWSLFSLLVSYYAEAKRCFLVPAGAFLPRPKVDSAVVRLSPKAPLLPPAEESMFFRLAKAAFAHRRKTFSNALSAEFGTEFAAKLFASCKISPKIRGEALFLETFVELSFICAKIFENFQG